MYINVYLCIMYKLIYNVVCYIIIDIFLYGVYIFLILCYVVFNTILYSIAYYYM